jgi:autotransporter-associated beta strand protein
VTVTRTLAVSTTGLAVGTHVITAVYSGDANYQPLTLAVGDQEITTTTAPPVAPPPVDMPAQQPNLVDNGPISGTAALGNPGLTKTGVGNMLLNGQSTYTGATLQNGAGGTITLGVNNALPVGTNLNVAAGTVDLHGQTQTVASLTGLATGNLALSSGGVLTTGGSNASSIYAGTITGNGSLVKVGTGTLALSGNTTPGYTGTTNVLTGAVLATATGGSEVDAVQSGATLGGTGTLGAVSVAAGGVLAPGTGAITNASWAAGVATITTLLPHGLSVGQRVTVAGVTPNGFNGTVTVLTVPSSTSFTYTLGTNPGGTGTSGTLTSIATLNGGPTTFNGGTLSIDVRKVGTTLTADQYSASNILVGSGPPNTAANSGNPILVLNTGSYTTPLTSDPPFTILTSTAPLPAGFFFNRPHAPGVAVALTDQINDGDLIAVNGLAFKIHYLTNSVTAQFVGLATTATFSETANPSDPGTTVGITVSFTPATSNNAIPQGTVTFTDSLGGTTFSQVTVPLDPSGSATTNATFTLLGTHTITATLNSTNGYAANGFTYKQVVNEATVTSLTASAGSVKFGEAVTYTATVSGTGGVPTGTVTFLNASTGAYLGNVPLDGNGQASFTVALQGTSVVQASYNGDSTFRVSVGNTLTTVAPKPAYYTNAVVIGTTLFLVGNGVPGGVATFPVTKGSFAIFTDLNGDGYKDVILFLNPNLFLVLDGATGQFLDVVQLKNGKIVSFLAFNPDGTITKVI